MTPTIVKIVLLCAFAILLACIAGLVPAAMAQTVETPAKGLPGSLAAWFGLAAVVISVANTVYSILSSPSKKNADHLKGVDEKLTDHEKRIQSVEDEMRHLPDRDSQHRVELALAQMTGRFEALDERLKPIAATSERLSEFLLDQARKS